MNCHAHDNSTELASATRKPMQTAEKTNVLVRLNPAAQQNVDDLFFKYFPILPSPAAEATSETLRMHHVARVDSDEVKQIVLNRRHEARQQLTMALLGIEHLLREVRRIPMENRMQERMFA